MNKNTSQILKGLASIMVLMYHLKVHNIFSSCGGYMAVGIFYFMSGYNLSWCNKNREDYTKGFILKKFIRIFIPFYVIYLAYQPALFKCFKPVFFIRAFNPKCYCNYEWYAKALIYIYIWYYVLAIILKKIGKKDDVLLGFLTWIIAGVSMITFTTDPNHFLPLAFIIGWCFALCGEKMENVFRGKYFIMLLTFALIILGHASNYYLYNITTLYILTQYLVPMLCGLLCYEIAVSFKWDNKILLFVGMISYEIYLIHPVFLRLLENLENYIYVPLMFVCTIAMSYVVHIAVGILDKKVLSHTK